MHTMQTLSLLKSTLYIKSFKFRMFAAKILKGYVLNILISVADISDVIQQII